MEETPGIKYVLGPFKLTSNTFLSQLFSLQQHHTLLTNFLHKTLMMMTQLHIQIFPTAAVEH